MILIKYQRCMSMSFIRWTSPDSSSGGSSSPASRFNNLRMQSITDGANVKRPVRCWHTLTLTAVIHRIHSFNKNTDSTLWKWPRRIRTNIYTYIRLVRDKEGERERPSRISGWRFCKLVSSSKPINAWNINNSKPSHVDLPAPLRPTTPMRLPMVSLTVTSLSTKGPSSKYLKFKFVTWWDLTHLKNQKSL